MRPSLPNPQSAPHIRMVAVQVLSDEWYVLKKNTFDYLRKDGTWQRQSRETYDRGDGAALLLFNAAQHTVVLARQFRMPVFAHGGNDGYLIEACAGLLDGMDAAQRIQKEVQEELGFHIGKPRKLFEAFMSPGSVTETLHFFAASYEPADRVGPGGGEYAEGEDIDVLELPFKEAMAMVRNGQIRDAKTILLLQHAALVGLACL